MPDILEIRWHGRGGQGAKTAALLLAEAASAAGQFVQGFPEYGPERMGAPVTAFNRISPQPITLHCHVSEPRVVVVLDPTLIGGIDVTEGLTQDGVVLVNTEGSPADMREKLGIAGRKVFTVDATGIAMDTIGRAIPNTPMMGALIKATGMLDYEHFKNEVREQMSHKFAGRPKIVEGNMAALERAYEEVQSE